MNGLLGGGGAVSGLAREQGSMVQSYQPTVRDRLKERREALQAELAAVAELEALFDANESLPKALDLLQRVRMY